MLGPEFCSCIVQYECQFTNIKLIDLSLLLCVADFERLASADKKAQCWSPTTSRGRTTLSSASCYFSRPASASTTASSASSRSRPQSTCSEDATSELSPSLCPLWPGNSKIIVFINLVFDD